MSYSDVTYILTTAMNSGALIGIIAGTLFFFLRKRKI